jgi:hypothetical protein
MPVPRLIVAAILLLAPALAEADPTPLNRPGMPLRAESTEVQLVDGSRLFLTLQDEQIEVTTPYGKLTIKLADILRVEFGTRLSAESAAKAATALALADSADDKSRDQAWKILTELKESAYPALLRLEQSRHPAVGVKAREMLAALRKSTPEGKLKKIDRDIIYTEYSKIVGRIDSPDLRARTPHFGDLKLRMADLASLQTGNPDEDDDVPTNVQPDPGSLTNFQQHVGRTFYFRVTGNNGGSVWGSDVYTTDSQLSTVAIHAGVLKPGQTGIVKVTIMPGQNGYLGSTRNGVSTSEYGPYPASYRVGKAGRKQDD